MHEAGVRLRWVKSIIALAVTLVLLTAGFPYMSRAMSPEVVVDQGTRPLLIVHIGDARRSPKLAFMASSGVGEDLNFVFSVSEPDISYGDGGSTKELPVKVLTVERGKGSGLSCASQGYAVIDRAFVDLPTSVRNAILVDSSSENNSALNHGNTAEPDQPNEPSSLPEYFKTERFSVWEGRIWLVNEESGKPYTGDASTYKLECRLSAGSVWRTSGAPWPLSDTTTFLPPQVNFVSDQGDAATPGGLEGSLEISRTSGTILREAYPPVSIGAEDWKYRFTSKWLDQIYYTDQPTLIFSRRSAADEKAIILMLVGAGIGVLVGLLASISSMAIDALWDRRGRRGGKRVVE